MCFKWYWCYIDFRSNLYVFVRYVLFYTHQVPFFGVLPPGVQNPAKPSSESEPLRENSGGWLDFACLLDRCFNTNVFFFCSITRPPRDNHNQLRSARASSCPQKSLKSDYVSSGVNLQPHEVDKFTYSLRCMT